MSAVRFISCNGAGPIEECAVRECLVLVHRECAAILVSAFVGKIRQTGPRGGVMAMVAARWSTSASSPARLTVHVHSTPFSPSFQYPRLWTSPPASDEYHAGLSITIGTRARECIVDVAQAIRKTRIQVEIHQRGPACHACYTVSSTRRGIFKQAEDKLEVGKRTNASINIASVVPGLPKT